MSLYIKNGVSNKEIEKKMGLDTNDVIDTLNIVDNLYNRKINILYAITGLIYGTSIFIGSCVYVCKIFNYI